jgi:hypothetical protein
MNHRNPAVWCGTALFALAAALPAQRPTPTFEWQKRTTTIAYGAVPLGKHSIAELPVGQTWRLGMGEASTWQLGMPVLVGDAVIAPGTYRINLERTDETHCAIVVNGSNQALGGGSEARVVGELGKVAKPSKKLEIEWQKHGAAAAGNQPARIVLQFGETGWQGDATIVGHKPATLGAWKLAVFTLPQALVEARDKVAVPVAALSRGKEGEGWNLVLGKDEAKLVPWMEAPTDQFGFGAVVPPDAKATTSGALTTAEIKVAKPYETVELLASALQKGEITLSLGVGQQSLDVRVPEPKAKAGK